MRTIVKVGMVCTTAALLLAIAVPLGAAHADPFVGGADLERLQQIGDIERLAMLRSLSTLSQLDSLSELRDFSDGDGDSGGTPVDEQRPLNPDGRIFVSDVAGSVDVGTWDKNAVRVTGNIGRSVEKLELSGDASNLSVVVRLPKNSHGGGSADLRLLVPAGARVELETVSADVTVNGVRGPLRVNTVSGEVGLAVASPEIAVQTVSGDLRLSAPAKVSRVNSVSGDLHLAGLQGKLSAETVSGNLELQGGGKFTELRLKSISGDMHAIVDPADAAQITGETLSGEITVSLPPNASGTAMLKSFSGEAFCPDAQPVAQHGGKRREYVFGDGSNGAHVELSSFSGDIRIEKR